MFYFLYSRNRAIRDLKHTDVIPVKTSKGKGAMSWKFLFPTPAKATVPRESRLQPRSCASHVWVSDCRPNGHPLVRSAPLKVSTAIYNRHPIELVPAQSFRTRRDAFPGWLHLAWLHHAVRVLSTRVLHQPCGLSLGFRLQPPWAVVHGRRDRWWWWWVPGSGEVVFSPERLPISLNVKL